MAAGAYRREGGAGLPLGLSPKVLAPAAIAAGAGKAVTTYADDERKLTRIGVTAEATREEMEGVRKEAYALAKATAQPFGNIVSGMETLAAQGRSLREIRDLLPAVAKTAQASGSEVADIAKSADAVGTHLKVDAKDMESAFDIMSDAGRRGSFELKDMARYLPSMLPAAKALGVEGTKGLSDISAMLQVIRKGTGSAEEAASSMQNIFAKLESEETTKRFSKMGIDLRKEMTGARKEGKNLLEVFEDLAFKAVKGDLSKIPQLFSDMEFARGMRALLAQRGEWQKMSAAIQKEAPGSTQRGLDRVLADTQARLDNMKTSARAAASEMGKLLAIPLTPVLDELAQISKRAADAYDKFDVKKTIDEASNRWDAKQAKKLRDDVDSRRGAIDEEIANRQAGIDDMDAADKQPVTGMLGRGERAKRRVREQAKIKQLREEREFYGATYDRMSTINTELGDIEAKRRAASSVSMGKDLPKGPGALTGDYSAQRFGFGLGGAPSGVPRFGDGYVPGAKSAGVLPPSRPDLPRTSADDIRAALGGGKIEATVTAPVTATLTGSAEVKGETTITVRVEAGSALLSAVESAKSASAALKGQLTANGPGGRGTSSPDAGAGGAGAAP